MEDTKSDEQKLWSNWNKSQECCIESLFAPRFEQELIFIVKQAYTYGKNIKVLGSGHSLGPVLLPVENQWAISLENYARILDINKEKQTVTVQAGATYKQLNEELARHGFALENLSSISDQTISGATQTGTHGTGVSYGALHTQIVEMKIINGKGELKTLSPIEYSTLFYASNCGIGVMGIISEITLKMIPRRHLLEQTSVAKWPYILDSLDELACQNEFFRFHWYPYANCVGICCANSSFTKSKKSISKDPLFLKQRCDMIIRNEDGISSFEDLLQEGHKNPVLWEKLNHAFFEANYLQGNEWIDESYRVLNHDFFDVFFEFSKNLAVFALEIALPIDQLKSFLTELQLLVESNSFPAHGPIEVRFVKADPAFLSPSYSENSDAIFAFVSIISILPDAKSELYKPYFVACQNLAKEHCGRHHWGKLPVFEIDDLKINYPKWEEFSRLREQEDPNGIFLNHFTSKLFE